MIWYIFIFIGLAFIGLIAKLYFELGEHIDKMIEEEEIEPENFSISKADNGISWDIHRMVYLSTKSRKSRNYRDIKMRIAERGFEMLSSLDDIEKIISPQFHLSCDDCKLRVDYGLGICTMCDVLKEKVNTISRHKTLNWTDQNRYVEDFEIPKIKPSLFESEEVSKYKPRNYKVLIKKPTVESMHEDYIYNIKSKLTSEYYNEKRQ